MALRQKLLIWSHVIQSLRLQRLRLIYHHMSNLYVACDFNCEVWIGWFCIFSNSLEHESNAQYLFKIFTTVCMYKKQETFKLVFSV